MATYIFIATVKIFCYKDMSVLYLTLLSLCVSTISMSSALLNSVPLYKHPLSCTTLFDMGLTSAEVGVF
jgi:hypothetical protein